MLRESSDNTCKCKTVLIDDLRIIFRTWTIEILLILLRTYCKIVPNIKDNWSRDLVSVSRPKFKILSLGLVGENLSLVVYGVISQSLSRPPTLFSNLNPKPSSTLDMNSTKLLLFANR